MWKEKQETNVCGNKGEAVERKILSNFQVINISIFNGYFIGSFDEVLYNFNAFNHVLNRSIIHQFN